MVKKQQPRLWRGCLLLQKASKSKYPVSKQVHGFGKLSTYKWKNQPEPLAVRRKHHCKHGGSPKEKQGPMFAGTLLCRFFHCVSVFCLSGANIGQPANVQRQLFQNLPPLLLAFGGPFSFPIIPPAEVRACGVGAVGPGHHPAYPVGHAPAAGAFGPVAAGGVGAAAEVGGCYRYPD